MAERIDYAYQLVLGRRATSDEVREGGGVLVAEQGASWLRRGGCATSYRGALASYMRVLLSSNEFMFVE